MAATAASKAVLDFSNVKERGEFNPKQVPAGDYRMKITKVIDSPTKTENKPQWIFTLQLVSRPTHTYPYRCQLQENTLWKVRNLFIAAGMNVPKKKVNVDPNKLVGKEVGASLDDHEYDGKMSSEIVAVFPVSDLPASAPTTDAGSDEDTEGSEEIDTTEPAADEDVEEIEIEEV